MEHGRSARRRKLVSYVRQNPSLLGDLTVFETLRSASDGTRA